MKNILVLTGGGPAPALNATLMGICTQASEGYRILGGIGGWASLAYEKGKYISLEEYQNSQEASLSAAKKGGSLIQNTRTKPSQVPGGMEMIQRKLEEWNIHAIIPIGGDDTLGFAYELSKLGYNVVAAPKTIDNDLSATYWTPGFPTAAARLAEFTEGVVNHASTTGDIHFIETFGGKAGWLTAAAHLGGAQVIAPPEKEVNIEALFQKIMEVHERDGYAVVAVSHEAKYDVVLSGLSHGKKDQYGHERSYFQVVKLREMLMERTDVEVRAEAPAYYLMGANPICEDRSTAMFVGDLAMRLVKNQEWGSMAAVHGPGSVKTVQLSEAVGQYRRLTDKEFNFSDFSPRSTLLSYLGGIIE